MKRLLALALLALLFIGSLAGENEDASFEARERLASLLANRPEGNYLVVQFEERRRLPFRRNPIVRRGAARILANQTVSIEYPDRDEILLVNDKGAFLKEGARPFQQAGARHEQSVSLMRSLFTLDIPELERHFHMKLEQEGQKDQSAWRLSLLPKDNALRLSDAIIEGCGSVVNAFEIRFSPTRALRIEPLSEEAFPDASKDDKRRYFNLDTP